MTKVFFFIYLILVFGTIGMCNSTERTIIIVGYVENIPSSKIYLTDAYSSEPIDSANIIKDHFVFRMVPDDNFEPSLVSLKFYDKEHKRKVLTYKNIFSSPPSGTNAFMLEKGTIIIKGKVTGFQYNGTNQLDISVGKETKAQYNIETSGFGQIRTKDSHDRNKLIQNYRGVISKFCYSHFLIQQIFRNRNSYTNSELKELLSAFDTEIQNSEYAGKIKSYIENRGSPGIPLIDFILPNRYGVRKAILDTNFDLNLIIFWASWCAPCLEEIPDLKEIHEKFGKSEISMSSISIDKDSNAWRNTLINEKMTWRQFITDSSSDVKIKANFDFSAIPVIFLIDRKKKIIQRYDGYSETKRNEIIAAIENFFATENK